MTFALFLDSTGATIAINPAAVALLRDVPGSAAPPLAYLDLVDSSLPRLVVQGTAAAVGPTLVAASFVEPFLTLGGPIALVGLVDLAGVLQGINPSQVAAVTAAPGIVPACFVDLLDPSLARIAVPGTVLVVADALRLGAAGATAQAAGYSPFLSASGGGVAVALGSWRAVRVAGIVHVVGQFSFVPAAPAVAETVTFAVPDGGAGLPPPAPSPFLATTDASGVASTGPGSIALPRQPRAVVGTSSLDVILLEAGPNVCSVAFAYAV